MSDLAGVRDQRDTGVPPDPRTVTTMDGTPTGPVVNGPLEGNPEAGPAAEPPAMTNAELEALPAAERQTLAQKVNQRRFKDDARSSIYERRDSMSLEERQALEEEDPEASAILVAQAGGAALAPEGAAPAPVPAQGPAAPVAQAPVASNEKRYTLSVYGQEQSASEADVIAAGIAALQKQHAADSIMREATTYEASLNQYRDQLLAWANEQARRTATVPAQAQPGMAGNAAPTSPGVAAAVDTATVQKAVDAFANDDAAGMAKYLQQAVSDAVAAGRQPASAPTPNVPMPQPGDIPRLQRAAADPWGADQRDAANRVFNNEFAHFTDAQFAVAKAAMDEAVADPSNHGVKLENLVRTVCRTTARSMPASVAPAPQPVPANPLQEQLENRRVLKARIPVTTPAAMGRAPGAAPPAVTYQSPSDYVQRLRQRSGSNSTR